MFADEANSKDKQRGSICAELFIITPKKIFCRDLKIPKNIFFMQFVYKLHTICDVCRKANSKDKQRGSICAELFIIPPINYQFLAFIV